MSGYLPIVANIAAILILVFGIYVPRHRHRDMVVAYLGINAGVLAVTSVLSSVDASLGVGIGLFGVLSIIRLRSDELSQREVAYYFASLALGLLGGIATDNDARSIALMAGLLAVLWIGDHPRLLDRYRSCVLTLDRALLDEKQVINHLTPLVDGQIRGIRVLQVNLVNDTTIVDVRYTSVAGPVAIPHDATATAPSPLA